MRPAFGGEIQPIPIVQLPQRRAVHPVIDVLGITLLFLGVLMPLLFLDVTFHDAIENINVATAMELRRDGHWAMPRLLGEVRWAKPPLTTWITASGITSRTLGALAGSDPAAAESGLRWLAFETRWPAALASCLMLAAIYELGRTLGGRELGLIAALVAGTSLLFVRQSHTATIDAQLALCVAAANMFLAKALFTGVTIFSGTTERGCFKGRSSDGSLDTPPPSLPQGGGADSFSSPLGEAGRGFRGLPGNIVTPLFAQKRWLGLMGAGLAIGLGLMHKGPVVLLQTVVPVLLFLPLWRRQVAGDAALAGRAARKWMAPLLLGSLVALLIGGWWYALMVYCQPHVFSLWLSEMFRPQANITTDPDKWFTYLLALQQLMPWLPFVLIGAIAAMVSLWRRQVSPMTLILFWAVVPVLLMTLAPDKRERYLFPMLGPTALLAATVLTGLTTTSLDENTRRWLLPIHWVILAAIAVGYPVSLILPAALHGGSPDVPRQLAVATGLAALASVLICFRVARHWPWAIFAATAATMLASGLLYWVAEDASPRSHSPMEAAANIIRQQAPDASLRVMHERSAKLLLNLPANKLSIYLNRTITCVDNWPPAATDHRSIVILQRQPRGVEITPPPPGWQEFWRASDRKVQWRLYRLNP